ncbi:unnamed protein product [Rotaria sp. Silwood2]|nr:unnamed protein product [Rotaria sp. Silwood2]CAF4456844.1 unnamed protein product [Rotaria sp. Silwood2]CAF4511298.1 unnamed protein product [Rotaria sp. Silwood2]
MSAIDSIKPSSIQYKKLDSGDVQLLISKCQLFFHMRKRLDFTNTLSLSDDEYKIFTSLSKNDFDDLISQVSRIDMRDSNNRSIRTAIAILLCKLRLGLSNRALASPFQLQNELTISKAIKSARSALMSTFVPLNLGFNHISRREIIEQHTSGIARDLMCDGKSDKAIIVVDGTYVYIQDDVIVVDRDFRDAFSTIEGFGFDVASPPFLNGRRQFTTNEANESRCVTKVRWVVEAVNARLKQFKFLSNTVQNSSISSLEDYLSIACAIINRYRGPVKTSSLDDAEISAKMQALRVYQLKRAHSYAEEKSATTQLTTLVEYEIYRCNEFPNLIRVPTRSAHVNRLSYNPIIQFTTEEISDWWCDCPTENTLIGCCSHVASAVWFLSFQRWQFQKRSMPSGDFINFVTDSKELSDFYDSTDDDDVDA